MSLESASDLPSRLEPTGERHIPKMMQPEVEIEHWHRYSVAALLVAGKRVLDIASGEGYGSALLAAHAASVIGVDISAEAIEHAAKTYARDNLYFLTGSCDSMPTADASVDVVVSFETLEHHDKHKEMFAEIKRVLVPGGLCVISTPDRVVYSELPGYENPYHVKELSTAEFESLVARNFVNYRLFGQKYSIGSILVDLKGDAEAGFLYFRQNMLGEEPEGASLEPTYLIAVASDEKLPVIRSSFLDHTYFFEHERANAKATEERLVAIIRDEQERAKANEAHLLAVIKSRDHLLEEARVELASRWWQRVIRALQRK